MLAACHEICDDECENYLMLSHLLSADADIVHSPDFESAVVKLAKKEFQSMTSEEKRSVKLLQMESGEGDSSSSETAAKETSLSCFEIIQQWKEQRIAALDDAEYINVGFIVGTSNSVEHLFSAAKLILADHRKSMLPIMFEAVLFLKKSWMFWDVQMVASTIKARLNTGQEEQDGDFYYED